jgi:Fe-S-cluster containining protein
LENALARSGQGVDLVRTCPGHCCVAFYLPTSHDRVEEMREGMRDGGVIAEMVIPLSLSEANERLERFGSDREYGPESEGHVYTCRHFDDETRLCTIYEQRPEMCRDFPYAEDGGCEYGCGYCAPPATLAKWTLLKAVPSRACPPREPMSQR